MGQAQPASNLSHAREATPVTSTAAGRERLQSPNDVGPQVSPGGDLFGGRGRVQTAMGGGRLTWQQEADEDDHASGVSGRITRHEPKE